LFVAVVLAIVAVVALLPHVQALEPVGAAELVERTRDARRRFAPFLVPPVAAVEVAITAFGLWQAQPSARLVTAEVVRLAFAICCEFDKKKQLCTYYLWSKTNILNYESSLKQMRPIAGYSTLRNQLVCT
jgi:hypothetical protein